MKSIALVLCLAAGVVAIAQTAAKPATTTSKPSATATKPAAASTAEVIKYPTGKPASPVTRKTLFALRVQDLKVGTGAEAEPLKMYKVKYTGWRAADGVVFDSWDQHPTPVMGADGKPEVDADGKPKTTDPQPATFPVGLGRMIPGFDQGFSGMRVGGIRRIFVPWQLGYGSRGIPERSADHPGIPSKSDLVFEVELVDISDLPAPPANHPAIPQGIPPGVPGGKALPTQPQTPPPSQPSTPPPSSQPSTPPPSN
jgi:peptidylprolyl isomerase